MSRPADDPTAATQIGAILAAAEQQVTEILSAAQRHADDTHAQAREALDERAAELAGIAQALTVSAQLAQQQLQRLEALKPLSVEAAPAAPEATVPTPAAPTAPVPPTPEAAVPPAAEPSPPPAPAASEPAPPTAAAEAAANPALAYELPTSAHFTPTGNQWVTTPHEEDLPIVGGSAPEEAPVDAPDRIDSARLVALSMAASGRSREEVEAHVRDELGISEPGPLIDYVFGISTPASIVPSWPPRRGRRAAH